MMRLALQGSKKSHLVNDIDTSPLEAQVHDIDTDRSPLEADDLRTTLSCRGYLALLQQMQRCANYNFVI
jgi:hypothetical protein